VAPAVRTPAAPADPSGTPISDTVGMGAQQTTNDPRSQRERMLAGELYLADDPQLAADHRRAMRLLAELLGALGPEAEIRPPLYCDYGYQIRVGARTFVNFGLMALDVAPITIGDDVQIGPNVQLLTPTHPVEAQPRREKWEAAMPITIEDNAWLGGGVIVLPGVTIGMNTVVGAGAVVTKDLPADVIAVGNPARVLRRL